MSCLNSVLKWRGYSNPTVSDISVIFKEDMATSHIPVILLTARGDLDSTTIGYKLGADAYLAKPFDMELLLAVISNQLKNRELSVKWRQNNET